MRIRSLKNSLRTLGVDDGYFPLTYKKRAGKTIITTVACDGIKISDIRITSVTVDGLDATESVVRCLKDLSSKYLAVFLDGVTYAGFNIVDPEVVYKETSIPAITIFKHRLNLNAISTALKNNFNDWLERYATIKKVYENSHEVQTPRGLLALSCYGIDLKEAYMLTVELQVLSYYPEPLRLADIIASGLTRSGTLLELINRDSQVVQR